MLRATVHNLRTEKMKPEDVRIDRKSIHGNKFIMGRDGDRNTVCDLYEYDLAVRILNDSTYREKVKKLHGKRLFCWCHPMRCHGDSLAAIAEMLYCEDI